MPIASAVSTAPDLTVEISSESTPASTQAPAARVRRHFGNVLGVSALTLLVMAVYTLFEIEQQRRFQTAGYDLGIFDQGIRGYAHFGAPISVMKGVHNNFGPNFSILGDHFSPILALLGPVYRLFPHATALLIAQGVLFAASVPSVWLFTRRKLGTTAAYIAAVAYALSWGLQAAMAADFHEIAFAVPLLAVAIDRLDAGRLRAALIAAALLLLVKEDFGIVVAVFGLVLGMRTRRWRIAGVVAVVGIATTVLADKVLIPAAGGSSSYYWAYYSDLGANPLTALWHVVRHPLSTWRYAFTPHDKITLLRWLFLPLGLASVASSYVLLAVPLLVERLLSSNPNHWTLTHQYSAPLMPILFLAAIDAVARLRRLVAPAPTNARHRRADTPARLVARHGFGPVYAAGVLAVAVWACTRMPFHQLTQADEFQTTSYMRAQQAALTLVPNGAKVEASNWLAPHLVDRATVLLLDKTPHNQPWVVFDEGNVEFPFASAAQQQQRVSWLLSHGYQQVFEADQIYVYHRWDGAQ